ncbi:MAG: TlpA family protein disulfide reductase [Aquificae bacterium]|nr:TlpA family protein disulfide reductase [Aquificota bacterium]
MRKFLPALLALVLFALLVYVGTQKEERGARASSLVGKPVPDVVLKTPEGRSFKLSDFKGKVVLINFWATWCPPCREEFELFKEVYEKYKDRGFVIVAVNTDPENLEEFLRENPLPFVVAVGDDEVIELFGVRGLPTSFLVNREGIVVKERLGVYRELEKDLKELL